MLHSRLRWLLIGSLVVMARGLHRIRSLRLNNDNGKALLTASALISALALHATQPSSETCPLHHQLALLVGSELIDDTMEKSAMHPLAPSLEEYIRIDLTTWNSSEFKSNFLQSNALHDTLNGKGMIETFQVFQHKTDNDLYSIVRFGDRVNGYPGLVHGGISSLVIDSLYGWTLLANKLPFAFTANLTLNYRLAFTLHIQFVLPIVRTYLYIHLVQLIVENLCLLTQQLW